MKNLKYIATVIFLFFSISSFAQVENENIKKGNEAYKRSDFETAIKQYQEASEKNEKNFIASYNLGIAKYKANKNEEAINLFDKIAKGATNPNDKSNALYNMGVALQTNKKLQECIDAYKKALINNEANEDARHNLQLALQQQKQDQQKEKQEKEKQQENKSNDKEKKEENKPKPQQSNISKQDAEQKLDALQQKEKDLQDKMHKVGAANANKQEKDW